MSKKTPQPKPPTGLYFVRQGVDKRHPNGETPSFFVPSSKPGPTDHPMVKLDYLTWTKFYAQVQVVNRYGVAGLGMMLVSSVDEWLRRCVAVFVADDVCQTKGVDEEEDKYKKALKKLKKGQPKPTPESFWTIRFLSLVYEAGMFGRNRVKVLEVKQDKRGDWWGRIETIPTDVKPSIWRYLALPDWLFPWNNYNVGGKSFATGSNARDWIRAMHASKGPIWVKMDWLER